MTPEHLETLTASLATMKELRARISAVGDELNQAYCDQSGEWRYSAEGDAASEEIIPIEDIVGNLDSSIDELRKFVFLLSENPDFATIMGNEAKYAPVPDRLSSRDEIRAIPRKPGAPPYPFLERPEGGE
jgi:hypothetical protein